MKTNVFSRIFFLATLAVMVPGTFVPTFAQNDPNKEILVYFTAGIERRPQGQTAQIVSSAIEAVLNRFNIGREAVTSAFPDFDERDTLKTTADGKVISMPNMARIFRIHVPEEITREEVIDTLKKLPIVLFAEPNGSVDFDVIPNDQYFSFQWSLQAGGGTGRIQAPEAWDIFQGSSTTRVGIIDGGVDATHPDLSGKVSGHTDLYGYHGTHVAGIAAAKTNNLTGVAGVNWNAQILTKSISTADEGDDSYIYTQVVNITDEGADAINSSWRLTPTGRYSTLVRMGYAHAYKNNKVAVATIGNTGHTTNTVQYPGSFGQGIIAVGATDQSDVRAFFSTYGAAIDVTAPGVSILSTYRGGVTFSNPDYEYLSGTSMAAPQVTGIASLLKGYNSNLYNDDIENIIKLSADKVRPDLYTYDANGWNVNVGHGRVNAKRALDYIRPPYIFQQSSVAGGTDMGPSGNLVMAIYGAQQWGLSDGWYTVEKHEVRQTIGFSYLPGPQVWGRGVATVGWANEGPVNFGLGQCEAIPGTVTSTGATLRTHVYKVWNGIGQFIGWKPVAPQDVNLAYTVWSPAPPPLSVSISGPDYVLSKQYYTYSADVTGGSGNRTYQWYKDDQTLGTAQQQSVYSGMTSFTVRCDVHDNGTGENGTASLYVVNDAEGGIAAPSNLDAIAVPAEFSVGQNYPNPFNPETEISFGLPERSRVRITISDILGREILTLIDKEYSAGYQRISWKGTDELGKNVGSGIYFYRIMATGESGSQFTRVMKMVVTK